MWDWVRGRQKGCDEQEHEEQLTKLRRDIREWNEWRRKNRDVEIYLSGADLRNVDLSNADLYKANLFNADLSRANLSRANLRNANLGEVSFREADLYRANLYKANLTNANLFRTNLRYANLEGANLKGIDITTVKIDAMTKFDKKWRSVWDIINHPCTNRNLEGSDLSDTILKDVDLRNANLRNANLRNADLSRVDLTEADLRNADLSRVNLSNANLSRIQALSANFESATLTGACIQDWNINSKTSLNTIACEYIYLKYELQNNKAVFTDRRPHDPNRKFASGEFAQIFQSVRKTLDLYFRDGIDWEAVAYSFEYIATDDTHLEIQGINKTDDDSIIIKVDVPESLDKGRVEAEFWKGYKVAQKAFEGERRATERHLESQERQINQLMAKLDEFRTINITAENIQGAGYNEGNNTTNAGDHIESSQIGSTRGTFQDNAKSAHTIDESPTGD